MVLNPIVLENIDPPFRLSILQRPLHLRTLDLQRGRSDRAFLRKRQVCGQFGLLYPSLPTLICSPFCYIVCANGTQSFITVSTLVATISEFGSLLLLNNLGLNIIPASPIALVFSILYQFSRIVPSIYQFRIFGVVFNNKSFTYLLGAQVRHLPMARGVPSYPVVSICSVLPIYSYSPPSFSFSLHFQQPRGPRSPRSSALLPDNSTVLICLTSRRINSHHG